MKRYHSLLLASVFAFVFQANATIAGDLENEVRAVNDRWNSAFNRGDVEALANMYTPDAIVMPPNRTLTNPVQIRRMWSDMMSSGYRKYNINLVRIHSDGNTITVAGQWSATASTPEGGDRQYGGNIVNILERQSDGTLKSRLHAWN